VSETEPLRSRHAAKHGRRRTGLLGFLRDLAIILVVALLVSFLLKTFLIRSFYIPSSSMEDTLLVDDRIIVNQLVPDVMPAARGDVVVFRDPGGWLAPTPKPERGWFADAVEWVLTIVGLAAGDSDEHLIKRVIGMPGDHVVCCSPSGTLVVNGVEVQEPYVVIPEGQMNAAPAAFDVTVPEGALWLMGDNRYNSRDSLAHVDEPSGGFVPLDHVVGKALVISWPIERWRVVDSHETSWAGVPDATAAER